MDPPPPTLRALDLATAALVGVGVALACHGPALGDAVWPVDASLLPWVASQHDRGLLQPLGPSLVALPAVFTALGTTGMGWALRNGGLGRAEAALYVAFALPFWEMGLNGAVALPVALLLWATAGALRPGRVALGVTGAAGLAELLCAGLAAPLLAVVLAARALAGPGLGLLGAALALGAGAVSIGPVVAWAGEPVVVAGRLLPAPAALFELLGAPPAGGWSVLQGAALCGAVLAIPHALRLAAGAGARLVRVLQAVLALQVIAYVALVLPGRPWGARDAVDRADLRPLSTLARLDGAVAHLPADLPEGATTARRAHAVDALQALAGHAAFDLGDAGIVAHPAASDPLLPLFWNAEASETGGAWALPPGAPGEALASAGVRWVVVHRAWLQPAELAFLEPILRAHLGPPQRDLVADLDLYRLPSGSGGGAAGVAVRVDGPLPTGWRTQDEALAAWAAARRAEAAAPLDPGPARQ